MCHPQHCQWALQEHPTGVVNMWQQKQLWGTNKWISLIEWKIQWPHSTVIIATANAQTVETANKDQSDAILYQHSWNVTQPIKF